ncbi:MAG: helix-turn-helix transcriptional regulator [Myxococcales bacterium]|nr:helix-turn-helix transcriptional regulator [Myxococcales bacterium]
MTPEERRLAARLGGAIRRHRELRRWSQATLAERLDVSVNYVSLLERGERLPAVGMLVAIARVVGTDVGALIEESDSSDWLPTATRLLRAVKADERETVLAMLRGLAAREAQKRKR